MLPRFVQLQSALFRQSRPPSARPGQPDEWNILACVLGRSEQLRLRFFERAHPVGGTSFHRLKYHLRRGGETQERSDLGQFAGGVLDHILVPQQQESRPAMTGCEPAGYVLSPRSIKRG